MYTYKVDLPAFAVGRWVVLNFQFVEGFHYLAQLAARSISYQINVPNVYLQTHIGRIHKAMHRNARQNYNARHGLQSRLPRRHDRECSAQHQH